MAFRFRNADNSGATVPALRPTAISQAQNEGLTGFVHGMRAGSDDEERFARSFDKYKIWFEYQKNIYTLSSLPNMPKKVDFVLKGLQPFEPRGYISHQFSIGQKTADRLRELELNVSFEKMGLRKLKYAYEGRDYGENQEDFDRYVLKEFGGLI